MPTEVCREHVPVVSKRAIGGARVHLTHSSVFICSQPSPRNPKFLIQGGDVRRRHSECFVCQHPGLKFSDLLEGRFVIDSLLSRSPWQFVATGWHGVTSRFFTSRPSSYWISFLLSCRGAEVLLSVAEESHRCPTEGLMQVCPHWYTLRRTTSV